MPRTGELHYDTLVDLRSQSSSVSARFSGPFSSLAEPAYTEANMRATLALTLTALLLATGCKSAPTPPANTPFSDQAPQSRQPARAEPTAAPSGDFDFYLLNLSWSPEFCATHANSPECPSHPGFVVHGLWPQRNDGSYPENCGDAPGPANPQSDTDLMPTASLVRHEWQTHGTCTGLDAETYFATVRKAFHEVKLPSDIGRGDPDQTVSTSAILDEFKMANPSFPAESLALSCGNNRLTAIEVCFSKDLQPEACQGVRSCRAGVIRVTPQ